jgi:hypothetical protein
LVLGDNSADHIRLPLRIRQRQIQRQVQLGRSSTVEGYEFLHGQVKLAEQHAGTGVPIDDGSQLGEQLVQARLVARVDRFEPAIRQLARLIVGVRRIVAPLLVFEEQRRGIEPKAVDAAIEPKFQRLEHRRAHARFAPVQIGL